MRVFITLASWILVLVGAVLVVAPLAWFPPFYDARYTGLASLLGGLIIPLIPRFFTVSKEEKKDTAVLEFQFLLTLFMIANTIGELGFFRVFQGRFQYDKLLHFGISFVSVWRMPELLERRYEIRAKRAIAITTCGIIAAGMLWEVYEFLVDSVWHTRLLGVFGSDVRPDTIADIIWNSVGAASGAALAFHKARQLRAPQS